MDIIRKTRNNKYWLGILVPCWWECKLVQALENRMVVPQKIKTRITLRSSNSPSGFLFEGNKNKNSNICSPMLIATLLTITKACKQPKCLLMDTWIEKMWYIYIYTMEYYSAIKRMKACHLQQYK